jgi:hypothetical protein
MLILGKLLDSIDEKIQLTAASTLLDRGFGKAPLTVHGMTSQTITVLHLVAAREVTDEIMRAMGNMPVAGAEGVVDGEPPTDLTAAALE